MQPVQEVFTLNYVEFNVRNIDKSKEFYGQAMGWIFTDFGENYCEFTDGQMKGGFERNASIDIKENEPSNGPLIVLYTTDLSDAQKRIEAAGGKIIKPVFNFPGGRRFHFLDPDSYQLAVWSDIQN